MSQENVELTRQVADDYLGGTDESSWEAWISRMVERLDPAIDWDASEVPAPDLNGVLRGRESVRRWWREWLSAWETVDFEYELVDAGDSVVMLVDQRMRGRSTGIEVPLGKYAQVATFSNGLIIRWKYYANQAEALEAVGLSG